MKVFTMHRPRGFSLIEIIITLVVLGIAGAMLAVFMGPGVTRSSDPIRALQNDASLQAVIEGMIADASNWDNLKTNIQNTTYGACTVERNCYCVLNANAFECDNWLTKDTASFLCVTISHTSQSGSKISYLFTKPSS